MNLAVTESKDKVYQGEVKEIRFGGKGRFATTFVPGKGQVTFSLDPSVWGGEDDPMTGEMVDLTKLRLIWKKWRAYKVTRILP